MQVIRDELWNRCFADAVKMYRLSEPDEKCYKLADATWKCKMMYKQHADKKQQRQAVVIDKPPEEVREHRNPKKTCCALTMSGKPCSFKAVVGEYCKKHCVKKTSIGVKVDVHGIKIAH